MGSRLWRRLKERKTFRVFLSSTSLDLAVHRAAVEGAIRRLGEMPVAMGSFGAVPGAPVEVCLDFVRQCDALVVLIGNRCGWIPRADEGGDGEKSVTRLEVEEALRLGKPVFALLADPDHPLPEPDPADGSAEDEAHARSLAAFRRFVDSESGLTRDLFTTPDDAGMRAATSLAAWAARRMVRVRVVPIAAVVTVLIAATFLLNALDPIDRGGWLHRLDETVVGLADRLAEAPVDPDVVVAVIDEESERALDLPFGARWRPHHARLIERLAAAGAAAVGLDMAFSTPTPADDALGAAMAAARNAGTPVVVGATRWDDAGRPIVAPALADHVGAIGTLLGTARAGIGRFVVVGVRPQGTRLVLPGFSVALLMAAERVRDFEILELDRRDDVVRVVMNGRELEWRVFEVVETDLRPAPDAEPRPHDVARAAFDLPALDAFRSGQRVAYEDLLGADDPTLRTLVGGRIVVVGVDRPDERRPVTRALRRETRLGVELHASALSTLARGRLLHRAGWRETLVSLAAVALLGAWLGRSRPVRAFAGLLVAATLSGAAAVLLYARYDTLLRPGALLLALLLSFGAAWWTRQRLPRFHEPG